MFEGFPYTNFHELNLDWIIKIAKDFLDQYTNIQQTINQGLEDLDTKAQHLEQLLQAWYDEHSDDIANQLAEALQDLNAWYTEHEGYLDQTLATNIAYFNTRAEAKMEETLASIPADYSALASTVDAIKNHYDSMDRIPVILEWEQGSYTSAGTNIDSDTRIRTEYLDISRYSAMPLYCDNGYLYELDRYDENYNLIETIGWNSTPRYINLEGIKYIRFLLCKSGNTNIIPSEGIHLQLYGFTPLYEWSQKVNSEFIKYKGYVNSNTMATVLPDANSASLNSYYLIRFTEDETNILPNLPFDRTILNDTDFLALLTFGNNVYKYQILFTRETDIYTRMCVIANNHWFPWTKNSGDKYSTHGETIHVGSGYRFAKLTDAMKYAFEHANTTVIVHPGTYNIITEMGADYWSNFSGYSDLTHAIIGNNSHFIFSPDARVECNYSGDNNAVRTLYSPFNSLDGKEGSFTIEGLVLRVSGCRYAIHDDVGASTVEQTHKYINCDIANDIRCIGAGLGADMTVEMRDCLFTSTGSAGNNPVSWHNAGGGTTGKSSIVMTGCYITGAGNNTVQFLYHGISTKLTRILLSNNSMTAPAYVGPADAEDVINNIELISWNNNIR